MSREAPSQPVIRWETTATADACREILATLPHHFGIPEANAAYAEAAENEPTVVARIDGEPVGLLTLRTHNEHSREVHLLAVRNDHRRQGLGAALIAEAERATREANSPLLQVKTLGPSDPDPEYAETRAFYEAHGFLPLEEFHTLWGDTPALLMIKPLVVPSEH